MQLTAAGRSGKDVNQAMARKMVTPGGVGHYALGFTVDSDWLHRPAKAREARRFSGRTGANCGFRSSFEAHLDGERVRDHGQQRRRESPGVHATPGVYSRRLRLELGLSDAVVVDEAGPVLPGQTGRGACYEPVSRRAASSA